MTVKWRVSKYIKIFFEPGCSREHNYVTPVTAGWHKTCYRQTGSQIMEKWYPKNGQQAYTDDTKTNTKALKFIWKLSYFNIVKWDKPESVTFLLALTWSNCRVSAKGKSIFKHESFMYWQLWSFNDFRSFKSSEI